MARSLLSARAPRAQKGHWKSPNSTIVTGAVAGPSAGASRVSITTGGGACGGRSAATDAPTTITRQSTVAPTAPRRRRTVTVMGSLLGTGATADGTERPRRQAFAEHSHHPIVPHAGGIQGHREQRHHHELPGRA